MNSRLWRLSTRQTAALFGTLGLWHWYPQKKLEHVLATQSLKQQKSKRHAKYLSMARFQGSKFAKDIILAGWKKFFGAK